ncbi:hypothetical protein [Selenomonas ruminantium]|uniref:hypothetical protein n=1 Tax=Selenomonas ruminantium TaxID=971 RepID=UPI00047A4356|nr:hypothetical protein [Selenomonas ruminantium]
MNFFADVVSELTLFFTKKNPCLKIERFFPPIPFEVLEYEDFAERNKKIIRYKAGYLLERLFTFNKKHISTNKRNVMVSQELKRKLDSNDYAKFKAVIEKIKCDFENGVDLNGRLSKLADNPAKNDLMLFEWNMYHLHLGERKEERQNGRNYYNRTGELLIVYIPDCEEEAYFVDITENHKNNPLAFSRQRYLDILNRNWPNLLSKFELPEAILESQITDEDRTLLRKKHVCTLNSIGGKTYLNPGIGVTSAATSIQILRRTDYLMEYIHELELFYRNIQKRFIPKQIPEYLDFKLRFDEINNCFFILKCAPRRGRKVVQTFFVK